MATEASCGQAPHGRLAPAVRATTRHTIAVGTRSPVQIPASARDPQIIATTSSANGTACARNAGRPEQARAIAASAIRTAFNQSAQRGVTVISE